jgi:hypothetical protein
VKGIVDSPAVDGVNGTALGPRRSLSLIYHRSSSYPTPSSHPKSATATRPKSTPALINHTRGLRAATSTPASLLGPPASLIQAATAASHLRLLPTQLNCGPSRALTHRLSHTSASQMAKGTAKRKAGGDPTTKSTKRAKLATHPVHTERELRSRLKTPAKANNRDVTPDVSNAAAAPDPTGEHVWEIMDGDSRDRLVVGVAAPERLILRLRNRMTDTKETPTYTKKAAEIDWNNADHIGKINKWRNQVFTRDYKFPPLVPRSGWLPYETAYLELLYQKLLLVAASDSTTVLPHSSKIVEAFHKFFDDRDDITDKNGIVQPPLESRTRESITSYIRRKSNDVSKLYAQIKDRQKDKSDNAQVPAITDAEIDAYMLNKTVVAGGAAQAVPAAGAGKGKKPAVAAPVAKKAATARATKAKPVKVQASKTTRKRLPNIVEEDEEMPDAPIGIEPDTVLSKPAIHLDKQTDEQRGEPKQCAHGQQANGLEQPQQSEQLELAPEVSSTRNARNIETALQDIDMVGEDQSGDATIDPPLHTVTPAAATETPEVDIPSQTELPSPPPKKQPAPGKPKGKPRWVKPRETAMVPTPPDVIAKIKALPGITYTELPKSDKEAIERHWDEYNKSHPADKPVVDKWNHQASLDLDERLSRRGAPPIPDQPEDQPQRPDWHTDCVTVSKTEDWHEVSQRKLGAAAVNGLLNAAVVPPLGYGGDLRDLVQSRRLPPREMMLHDASEAAREKMHEAHDKAFITPKGAPKQHNVDHDSDVEDELGGD